MDGLHKGSLGNDFCNFLKGGFDVGAVECKERAVVGLFAHNSIACLAEAFFGQLGERFCKSADMFFG